MKNYIRNISVAVMITASAVGAQAQQTGDTLVLDLGSAIRMAQEQSPEAQLRVTNYEFK